jgi:hypothetical protein
MRLQTRSKTYTLQTPKATSKMASQTLDFQALTTAHRFAGLVVNARQFWYNLSLKQSEQIGVLFSFFGLRFFRPEYGNLLRHVGPHQGQPNSNCCDSARRFDRTLFAFLQSILVVILDEEDNTRVKFATR